MIRQTSFISETDSIGSLGWSPKINKHSLNSSFRHSAFELLKCKTGTGGKVVKLALLLLLMLLDIQLEKDF